MHSPVGFQNCSSWPAKLRDADRTWSFPWGVFVEPSGDGAAKAWPAIATHLGSHILLGTLEIIGEGRFSLRQDFLHLPRWECKAIEIQILIWNNFYLYSWLIKARKVFFLLHFKIGKWTGFSRRQSNPFIRACLFLKEWLITPQSTASLVSHHAALPFTHWTQASLVGFLFFICPPQLSPQPGASLLSWSGSHFPALSQVINAPCALFPSGLRSNALFLWSLSWAACIKKQHWPLALYLFCFIFPQSTLHHLTYYIVTCLFIECVFIGMWAPWGQGLSVLFTNAFPATRAASVTEIWLINSFYFLLFSFIHHLFIQQTLSPTRCQMLLNSREPKMNKMASALN